MLHADSASVSTSSKEADCTLAVEDAVALGDVPDGSGTDMVGDVDAEEEGGYLGVCHSGLCCPWGSIEWRGRF